MALWLGGAAALALAAVAVGLTVLRRARARTPLDEAAAGQAATATIPGFATRAALVGDDRRAALVIGTGGRVALVTARRAGAAAREVRWNAVGAVDAGLRVETGARAVLVPGIDALDVRRVGGEDWRAPPAQPTKRTAAPSASRVTRATTP